ncbi:hypothetical protein COO91_03863 [Nostoc flagelliforme CCNUN1]|uniref:Uncharacterized protein n=1 Tax=Nostoc flagelliforme CCNUN1 TaxID=2038116 RepID=A0A2K8SR21_9NOSO|nr:hypothetical protein COO91_03863 [Nostoc flagelliforme CCNUN1]
MSYLTVVFIACSFVFNQGIKNQNNSSFGSTLNLSNKIGDNCKESRH